MMSRWHRPIERSRPDYGWGLLKATFLFVLLLAGEVVLVSHLVSGDLSRTHLIEVIRSYRSDVDQIAKSLGEILQQEGKYDLFKLKEKVTTLTQRVGDNLANRVAFHHISVYDTQGRLVATTYRLKSRFITLPGASEGDASSGTAAPPVVNRSRMPIFGGVRELPSTESAPERGSEDPPTADSSLSRQARALPSSEEQAPPSSSFPQKPQQQDQHSDPAPQPYHLDTIQRERLIVAPVAAGAGRGRAGVVQMGIDDEVLEAQVAQLRKDVLKKVVAGAFLSLVLLVVGFLYVLKLLQKTRRLEAEAQMADRLAYIGTLASGLAHEIRNPLNAMNMNLQMLEEELSLPPAGQTPANGTPPSGAGPVTEAACIDLDTRGLLESTKLEIRRLDRLVSNFLAYARPSAPNLEERDLNRCVEEIVMFVRADLASKGIEVVLRLDSDLPPTEIDEAQFKQALLNILINARQVLGAGGLVEVSTGRAADGVLSVKIADNGPGIGPEMLDRIFEVFYSTRQGGTGLGLPIAQRIVENHGGRIEVDSEVGRGTTFTIRLPRRHHIHPAAVPAAEPMITG